MAKKTKKKESQESKQAPPAAGLSQKGKKVIGLGVGIIFMGFVVLTRTDPRGQNWASLLSPFLILGGYGTVAFGIMLPDPSEVPAAVPSAAAPASPAAGPQAPKKP